MALHSGPSFRSSAATSRCNIGIGLEADGSSGNMSTGNDAAAGLLSYGTPASDLRFRSSTGRVTDSRISTTGTSVPSVRTSDTVLTSNGGSPAVRRDMKYAKDDVIATREVEFIASFPVTGEDQDAKTCYVRQHLSEIKAMTKTRPVLLVISLSGIKVSDITGETTLMAHALKRIAFATCFAELRQFSFIAREPKASANEQYCHAFLTRSAREAEELNMLVASAFRTAYAQSQSDTVPGQPPSTPHPLSPAAAAAAPSSSSTTTSSTISPSNLSSCPPTSSSRPSGASAPLPQQLPMVPAAASTTFDELIRAQLDAQRDEQMDRRDVLATRLSQISTPHVDRLVSERRQRRTRELSADGAERRATSPASAGPPPPSTDVAVQQQQQQVVPGMADILVKARKPRESPELRRGNSESPPSTNGCASVVRQQLLPQPSSSPNLPACAATTTSSSNGTATLTADSALVSHLLKALKGNGTDQRPHGSPVMILKELIDQHFNSGVEIAGILPISPIADGHNRPFTLNTSNVHQSPVSAAVVGRSEASAPKRSSPSSRSRPLSGAFVSNGEGFSRSQTVENGTAFESAARSESQRRTDNTVDDLRSASWYQPGIPREIVLDALAQQDVGAFVIRDSTTHSGCYALSIRVPKYDTDQGIAHYLITKTSRGTVRLKGMAKEWNSLSSLVTHHTVMRELLPCLLVLPQNSNSGFALNGCDRLNSEC